MTQTTGLSAAFFMIVLFTAVGFMVRLPLDKQGGKAVIQYLVLGVALVLAQDVMGEAQLESLEHTPIWWPAVMWMVIAVWIAATIAKEPSERRRQAAGRMGVCILLILFCLGVSYIAAASFTTLTGLPVHWAAASFFMAALVRNTTGMTEEEFPDDQSETMRRIGLCTMAVTLVMPA